MTTGESDGCYFNIQNVCKWPCRCGILHEEMGYCPKCKENRADSFNRLMKNACACGGIILADTEDWKVPICNECYEEAGKPDEDPYL